MSGFLGFVLNAGTNLAWITRGVGAASGKGDYIGDATNLFKGRIFTTGPKINTASLLNIINEYDNNPPEPIAVTEGTSAYYTWNAFVVLAKGLYVGINNGMYDQYAVKLGDPEGTRYRVDGPSDETSPGAKFFVFVFQRFREDLVRLNIGKLHSIVNDPSSTLGYALYTDAVPGKVQEYFAGNYMNDPNSDFIAKYKEYKLNGGVYKKRGWFSGGKRVRKGGQTTKHRKNKKNKSRCKSSRKK